MELLKRFKGERRIVISTLTTFGGSQHFLGVVYVIVAGVFLLFAVIFFCCIKHDPAESKREIEVVASEPQEISTKPILD